MYRLKYILWIISHLLLGLSLLIWYLPFTHTYCVQADIFVFKALNQTLSIPGWRDLWGILNHRSEGSLDLVLAAIVNLVAVISLKKQERYKATLQLMYFWLFFQLGFMLQKWVIIEWLHIVRLSPSMVIKPVILLSEVLHNPRIKDASYHSFLGGHAFAMLYWASFTAIVASKRLGIFALGLAFFLSLPRLFSGAHWASDVIFAWVLAVAWLSWTLINPAYGFILKLRTPPHKN